MPRLNVYRHELLDKREFVELSRFRDRDERFGEVTIIRVKELLPNGKVCKASRYFYIDGEAFAPLTLIGQIDI